MKLNINWSEITGKIKPMNAVNNGPVSSRGNGNLDNYIAANIPYARTHDASFYAGYGGYHTVDVHVIFPDFDADPYDPANYDFQLTDEYMEKIMAGGAKVFYRLGAKIEHESKKYGIWPPKDNMKWAIICEHIIAHMNEGWGDGHHYGIEYWEIWNEPDLYEKCWMGTPEEFYELFCVAAKHLKARFPHLKIGGPAVTGFNEPWLRPFFAKLREENVPLDFYSWHRYAKNVEEVTSAIRRHRALMDEYGYTETESILNEWNYVKAWQGPDYAVGLKTVISIKGAAFVAAVMAAAQEEPLDMLMYYDARPSIWNGLFSFYLHTPLKAYYSVKAWGVLASLGNACKLDCDVPNIYAAAASGEDGKMALISYFTDEDAPCTKTFPVEIAGMGDILHVYLLDEEHDMTEVGTICADGGKFSLTMEPNTVVVLK